VKEMKWKTSSCQRIEITGWTKAFDKWTIKHNILHNSNRLLFTHLQNCKNIKISQSIVTIIKKERETKHSPG